MKKLEGMFALGCILGLIAGGIVVFLGWQEKQLLDKGTPQPQQVTLAELAAKATIDNVHLTVTGFEWGDGYVVEEKKGTWNIVWIPIVPPGHNAQGGGNNSAIRVVIKSFNVKSENDLRTLAMRPQVTGVVTNDIHSMGSGASDKLNQSYPGANFSKAIVLEEGRSFPTSGYVSTMLGCGVGLIVLGVICGVCWIIARLQPAGYVGR
jgi:hypothetical protein